MQVVDHNMQATEEWRAGVVTRMRVSAVTGAVALCIFEQWCAPGTGAPTQTHPVEEVLTILNGQADGFADVRSICGRARRADETVAGLIPPPSEE